MLRGFGNECRVTFATKNMKMTKVQACYLIAVGTFCLVLTLDHCFKILSHVIVVIVISNVIEIIT